MLISLVTTAARNFIMTTTVTFHDHARVVNVNIRKWPGGGGGGGGGGGVSSTRASSLCR